MRVTLVLHNLRSEYNVGAILRTAEGLGSISIAYSGYTPRYDNPTILPHLRAKLNRQIAKSALGAEKIVPQEHIEDLTSWLEVQRSAGVMIIGLENNLSPAEQSQRLVLGRDSLPDDQEIILILGEEVTGITDELRNQLDYFLEIPMRGQKESFNVSVAAAIALWELTKNQEVKS